MSDTDNKKDYTNVIAAVFLTGVAGIAGMAGFSTAIGISKEEDAKNFEKGLMGAKDLPGSAVALARRAFLWGSVWAIGGCSLWCFGLWKFIGSPSFEEFRTIVRSCVKSDCTPPLSRTNFKSVTDLMTYVSEEWGKKD